jgi:DNA-binding transcriptional LysR family regulator
LSPVPEDATAVFAETTQMELRHLRYFLAIVAERHFTRAARRLGIAQPPLSQQIRQLEEEVGIALFARTARGVTLTAAGEAFLPHAEAALREVERARTAARRIRHGDLGTIRVGFTSAASLNPFVPGAISAFRNTYPDVELRLIVQPTTPLLAQLSQDQIDVAFVRPTSTERLSLRAIPLPDERLWIALPSGHALATRKRLRLDELRDEPFILYPRANGSLLYDSIIAACQRAGFSPRVVQEAPQMASMVSLVAAGVGVTLAPESVCQLRPAGVRYVRIKGQAPVAMLWLVAQRSATASVVDNFLRHAATFFKTPPRLTT